MQAISDFLEHFPVVTFIVVVAVIVAAVKVIVGDLDFAAFVGFTEKLLLGGGALGGARALLAHSPSRTSYPAARRASAKRH
jgi:type IV secretory pathway VirB2 component (pilin)